MSARRPFMPLFIADYRMDTLDFSTEMHGAYFLLLMECWNKDGRLPQDDDALARICGLSVKKWRRIATPIRAKFIDADDHLEHKRVNKELQKLRAVSSARSAAGKQGGRPPSQKGRASFPPQGTKNSEKPAESKASENQVLSSPRARERDAHARLETPDFIGNSSSEELPRAAPPKSDADTPPAGGFSLTPPEPDGKPKPKPKKVATRLPEDWVPDEKYRLDAMRLGLPAARVADEGERFRDWSRSSPNGAKLDWPAAWRNWVKMKLDRPEPAPNGGARGPPTRRPSYADDDAQRTAEANAFLDKIIAGKGS